MKLMCIGIDQLLSSLVFLFFFAKKKTRERKNNECTADTFFRMFVTTSVNARKQQDAYAITTKEREERSSKVTS